jgi:hypothetical protein
MSIERPVKVFDFDKVQVAPAYEIERQFDNHRRSINQLIKRVEDWGELPGSLARPALPSAASPRRASKAVQSSTSFGTFATSASNWDNDDDGGTATAQDWSNVSIAWAEYMPDTIPPNILATNSVTGDHWSSRWWANKAANLLSALLQGGLGVFAEQVQVVGSNALAALSNVPVDATTTMQVIVNGVVYSGCVTPRPFTVAGAAVTWVGPPALALSDQVVARYRYAVTPPATAAVAAISLYYFAAQGQTEFSLGDPDRFANSYALGNGSKVQVSRNGSRLTPDDGSGVGGFTVAGNAVTLLYPAGDGEAVAIDVWEQS